jgi:NADH-quinone oxidoreductase subunit G
MPVAELNQLRRAVVVGSFLRKDHPLMAQRLRQTARSGGQIFRVGASNDDWLMPMAGEMLVAPSEWVDALAQIAAAVAAAKAVAAPHAVSAISAQAQAIANALLAGEKSAVLLGQAAGAHPQASRLLHLANFVGEQTGASVGYLGDAGNAVGAQWVGAQPQNGGLNAGQMLSAQGGLKAALLMNLEPMLDTAYPAQTAAALGAADMVVAFTAFRSACESVADVMLPIAPFTETSGTFVNTEGRVQSFHGVVKPLGDARPAWKVLRVLGNMLEVSGFDFESSDAVRQEALGDVMALPARLSNASAPVDAAAMPAAGGLERLSNVPIYATDALVRRAPSLQRTADACEAQTIGVGAALWAELGLKQGDRVRVRQSGAGAMTLAARQEALAAGVVRVPAGLPAGAEMGGLFGALTIEKA